MKYSGDSRGHTVNRVEDQGNTVVLEDQSVWQVYSGFASRSLKWQAGDLITVKPSTDNEFPYLLVNVNCNDSVECQLVEDCA